MFFSKLFQKGITVAEGMTVSSIAALLDSNTETDCRTKQDGQIADLLLQAV